MSEIIDGSLLKILEYQGLYKPHSTDTVPGLVYDLNNLLNARCTEKDKRIEEMENAPVIADLADAMDKLKSAEEQLSDAQNTIKKMRRPK